MDLLLIAVIGYFIGSVPFALVVGKVFYKTDVREYGSKNLGGGNTGRVLGKKAGLAVMTLDVLKSAFVVFLAARVFRSEAAVALGGLAAAAGHCWPVFANFRGGKAVATLYGFLFGLFAFAGYGALVFFLPLAVFLVVLKLTKTVSLASMISAVAAAVYVYASSGAVPVVMTLAVLAALIVVRHRKNIGRMVRHEENKITWM